MRIKFDDEFVIDVAVEDTILDMEPDLALRAWLVRLSNNMFEAAQAQREQHLDSTSKFTMRCVENLWDAIASLPNPYEDEPAQAS